MGTVKNAYHREISNAASKNYHSLFLYYNYYYDNFHEY